MIILLDYFWCINYPVIHSVRRSACIKLAASPVASSLFRILDLKKKFKKKSLRGWGAEVDPTILILVLKRNFLYYFWKDFYSIVVCLFCICQPYYHNYWYYFSQYLVVQSFQVFRLLNTNTGDHISSIALKPISAGLELVLDHTEKPCIVSHYRQFLRILK